MIELRKCSRCGAELPADTPGGHCLPCLLQLGLQPDGTSAEEVTAGTISAGVSPAERPGDRIGRYKLLQKIGEGGCGLVYMAEQEEPVGRRVALKIIKLGMDTRNVIARFEAERQALAIMDHPNIAKVFDAGATESAVPVPEGRARHSVRAGSESAESGAQGTDASCQSEIANRKSELRSGRPYFVMELVRGVKITTYCDQQKLSTRQRLDLFIQVCQAVQHAHQKGIIHRDIKPSNILVTEQDGAPTPKIIDFGIAKATTDQRLTDKTLFTAFEQFIGTPAYMSPEQAGLGGLDVDTRSDIYSLGVLLYELLTGKPPFDSEKLARSALDEILRVIREQEPPRPSACLTKLTEQELTTVAQRRQIEAARLARLLRGDLDRIVMKALDKDRRRRYETANGLARDLERYLGNEPVVARPPSTVYRIQKLARRNKLAFAAGATVVLALSVGLSIATWSLIKERHARQRAATEAQKSQQVASFLKDTLKALGPSISLAWHDAKTLAEILRRTAERAEKELTNQPDVAFELRSAVAAAYGDLGLFDQMEEVARKNLSFARSSFGEENARVAIALSQLAEAQIRRSKFEEAESLAREALRMRRSVLGMEHADVAWSLRDLGGILHVRRKDPEAEAALREALDLAKRTDGEESLIMAEILNSLVWVLRGSPNFDAEAVSRQSLAIKRKLLGSDHPSVAGSLDALGLVLIDEGKLLEAENVHRDLLAMNEKLFGKDHPFAGGALGALGQTLLEQGRLEEAESMLRESVALQKKGSTNETLSITWTLHFLGLACERQGKLAEAESSYREAQMIRKRISADPRGYLLMRLANVLRKQGRLDEAKTMFRDAAEAFRKPADAGESYFQDGLAWLLATCLDSDIRDGRSAVAYAEKAVMATQRANAHCLDTVAAAYAEVGDFTNAITVEKEAIASNRNDTLKEGMASRLKLYEAGIPYRDNDYR